MARRREGCPARARAGTIARCSATKVQRRWAVLREPTNSRHVLHESLCERFAQQLRLDPGRLAEIMDESVQAVVPIHYSGVACDIDGIRSVL
jgi:hypothetical protein